MGSSMSSTSYSPTSSFFNPPTSNYTTHIPGYVDSYFDLIRKEAEKIKKPKKST